MNRLAKSGSTAFLIMSWFFVASLFADGANLDDLIPGRLVMHDDEDALSALPSVSEATHIPGSPAHHAKMSLPRETGRPPGSAPLRVMVDQDSPSLAPDMEPPLEGTMALAAMNEALRENLPPTGDDLYLRFRTLLI